MNVIRQIIWYLKEEVSEMVHCWNYLSFEVLSCIFYALVVFILFFFLKKNLLLLSFFTVLVD